MPTGNRPEFVRQSLVSFRNRAYANAELIVIDDGRRPVGDLCAGLPDVAYIRLGRPASAGAKLNIGIEQARGEIIQKWDDDDYHSPQFLHTAESRLPHDPDEPVVVLWDCFLILLRGERGLRHSGCGWQVGGTMCFHRRLWQRRAFRDVARSEDRLFLEDHSPGVVPVCAPEQYIVVRHGRNTWNRMEDGSNPDDYFWQLPVYPRSVESLVSAEQAPFYRSLTCR